MQGVGILLGIPRVRGNWTANRFRSSQTTHARLYGWLMLIRLTKYRFVSILQTASRSGRGLPESSMMRPRKRPGARQPFLQHCRRWMAGVHHRDRDGHYYQVKVSKHEHGCDIVAERLARRTRRRSQPQSPGGWQGGISCETLPEARPSPHPFWTANDNDYRGHFTAIVTPGLLNTPPTTRVNGTTPVVASLGISILNWATPDTRSGACPA